MSKSPLIPHPHPSPQAGRGDFDLRQRRGGVLVFDLRNKSNIYATLNVFANVCGSGRDVPSSNDDEISISKTS